MIYGEAFWSSGKRIAAAFNSLRNNIRREAGYRIIKRILLEKFPTENPGGRVAGMGDGEVKCFAEAVAIFPLLVRDLEEKVMG